MDATARRQVNCFRGIRGRRIGAFLRGSNGPLDQQPTPLPLSAAQISSRIPASSMVAGMVQLSPSAIFFMVPRRILPDRVLGSRPTVMASLKAATGPIFSRTRTTHSRSMSSGGRLIPAFSSMKRFGYPVGMVRHHISQLAISGITWSSGSGFIEIAPVKGRSCASIRNIGAPTPVAKSPSAIMEASRLSLWTIAVVTRAQLACENRVTT